MVYFYQLFFSTDDVVLKLYTSLCQKAKCTLFVWSTVTSEIDCNMLSCSESVAIYTKCWEDQCDI